ncbi:MAG: type I-U CRISPR-associated protein Csb2 [Pirellulaceae bacterium]
MMTGLAIGIRYLTGYAVATHPASRERAEWPPHPARVFMALAAAHLETDGDVAERKALLWLERQGFPLLSASDCDERAPVTSYVPVNDRSIGSGLLQSAALTRDKQPRMFPRVRPLDDTVQLIWPEAEFGEHRPALAQLCSKVTRLGHSSSLVQMWIEDGQHPEANWEPDELAAEIRLRVPTQGLLERLQAEFPDRRPMVTTWQGYRPALELRAQPHLTQWEPILLVRRLEPAPGSHVGRLDLAATLQVTAAMHKAIVSKAEKDLGLSPVPEIISGHKPDGSPSDQPHLAFFPLPFVATAGQRRAAYATGHLLGIGIAIPQKRGVPRTEFSAALAAIGSVKELVLGRLGKWVLSSDSEGKANLRPAAWIGAANGTTDWATVTPVAFDHHPKSKDRPGQIEELADMVARCCERIGLPAPEQVQISSVSKWRGVPTGRMFPRLSRKDSSQRRHAHVTLRFREPVVGPLAIGAGRYRGYGFCRPLGKEISSR